MPASLRRLPRNAGLLLALVALILVAPLIPLERTWFVVELLFDLILLAGVHSVGSARHRIPFLVLTFVTLAVRWGELLSGVYGLDFGALALTVTWLFYALAIITAHLFQQTDVTIDTILGAVVVYLLVAVAFSMLFQAVELTSRGSFSGLAEDIYQDRPALAHAMLYFSLVCITTMGFGDIVPVSNLARPLAVIEGVFGQLYLAVMIARLVGLHIATQSSSTDD